MIRRRHTSKGSRTDMASSPSHRAPLGSPSSSRKAPRKVKTQVVPQDTVNEAIENYIFDKQRKGKQIWDLGEYMTKSDQHGPDPIGIVNMFTFLQAIFDLCNYVRPAQVKAAVVWVIAKYPHLGINDSTYPHDLFAKFIADKIRIMMKHLRMLKRNASLRQS